MWLGGAEDRDRRSHRAADRGWRAHVSGLKHVVFLGHRRARSYMNPEELSQLGIARSPDQGLWRYRGRRNPPIALMWGRPARGHRARWTSEMRAGNWLREDGMQLTGAKTLGLIRLRRHRRRKVAAHRARAAAMPRHRLEPVAEEVVPASSLSNLMKLLTESDVVLVASAAQRRRTRGFISRACIEAMKPGVILVNTARGALVDEDGHDPRRCSRVRSGMPGSTSSTSNLCRWIIP